MQNGLLIISNLNKNHSAYSVVSDQYRAGNMELIREL